MYLDHTLSKEIKKIIPSKIISILPILDGTTPRMTAPGSVINKLKNPRGTVK